MRAVCAENCEITEVLAGNCRLRQHRHPPFIASTAVIGKKSLLMPNDGRELQSKAKEAQTTPLRCRRIHGAAENGKREQRLLKIMQQQASHYRANA